MGDLLSVGNEVVVDVSAMLVMLLLLLFFYLLADRISTVSCQYLGASLWRRARGDKSRGE